MTDDQTVQTDQATGVNPVTSPGAPVAKGGAAGGSSNGGVVVSKEKTAEQYMTEAQNKYIVPKLIRQTFPDLIKLIYETESMNEEEREYWLQIMPIMTEDQITKFRGILVNEKEQLSKLDNEYHSEMSRINKSHAPAIDEEKLRARMEKIKTEEASHDKEEKDKEAALLEQLENLG